MDVLERRCRLKWNRARALGKQDERAINGELCVAGKDKIVESRLVDNAHILLTTRGVN